MGLLSGPVRLTDPRLLARHQIAAAMGTVADFGAMVALVELAGLSPPVATAVSAVFGAVANFTLSRLWAFHGRHAGSFASQAIRYALVSSGGALLNAVSLALVLQAGDVPYPAARAAVALAVSVLYTYPLHARVVFRVANGGRARLDDVEERARRAMTSAKPRAVQ